VGDRRWLPGDPMSRWGVFSPLPCGSGAVVAGTPGVFFLFRPGPWNLFDKNRDHPPMGAWRTGSGKRTKKKNLVRNVLALWRPFSTEPATASPALLLPLKKSLGARHGRSVQKLTVARGRAPGLLLVVRPHGVRLGGQPLREFRPGDTCPSPLKSHALGNRRGRHQSKKSAFPWRRGLIVARPPESSVAWGCCFGGLFVLCDVCVLVRPRWSFQESGRAGPWRFLRRHPRPLIPPLYDDAPSPESAPLTDPWGQIVRLFVICVISPSREMRRV